MYAALGVAKRESCERANSMKRLLCLSVASAWIASAGASFVTAASPQSSAAAAPDVQYAAVVRQYCVSCHNDRLKTADLSLETLDLADVGGHADVWEKVVRKLRRGAMPPENVRRPDRATYEGLMTWLEGELDRAAVAHPNPGRPLPHRLNRAE